MIRSTEQYAAPVVDRPAAGGRSVSARPANARLVNAMSVDVEDYYQVSAFAGTIGRADWPSYPSRVEQNTRRILDLFAETNVRATFFMLGCLAERHPHLVREIVEQGHELASHGYSHYRVFEQTPAQFRDDVSTTKKILEDTGGVAVNGYRAASFSINRDTWWAFEVLAEAGHTYSSSVNPIQHDHYGVPDADRFSFRPNGSAFTEIPITTVEVLGRRLPCGGGGYFRLFPYQCWRWGLRQVNGSDGRAAVFYFHPWEIDPEQPRIAGASRRSQLRHYTNLKIMEAKLRRALTDFSWSRIDEVFLGDGRGDGRIGAVS
ncbi:XrtA system polysaccharide deacetylase [Virgifigura deserti]|uniref:XrtA system polysaccharide deacetylase n=1 Tax=Virgifigura deserti TaxID=2268457 RepID=UPI003CCB8463